MRQCFPLTRKKWLSGWKAGLLGLLLLTASGARANNILVSNVRLTDRDTTAGANNAANFTLVRFDLSWDNAWRLNYAIGMNNHDAAWVFVKYRVLGGTWRHAHLHVSGHDAGSWGGQGAGPALVEIGLMDPSAAFDVSTNPGMGVFVSNGSINPEPGAFSATNMRVRWNYGAQGIADNALVEIQVTAIEMVYVPRGAFFVGTQGQENGSFTNGSWTSGPTIPLRIAAEDALTIGTAADNLWGRAASGDSTIGSAGTLPAAFPKGYSGFYTMKYEITQRQWADFFNTLYDTQQDNRDITGTDGKNSDALTNRNNLSWSSGEALLAGEAYADIPCNYMGWADLAAYLDWAALRPMTELEYEKATRGERSGVANEYAWGTDGIAFDTYSLANAGQNDEIISANYSSAAVGGNAWYTLTQADDGPVRVGIFAADTASTGRTTASATRYGVLEMSGNVWERTVSVAADSGRLFTGIHGNGLLTSSGFADEPGWPGMTANGTGLRGGGWNSPAAELRVADRSLAAAVITDRDEALGGRGVRTRVCSVPVAIPAAVSIDTLEEFGNVLEITTSGAGVGEGYLWVLPSDWRIISGQGTSLLYVTVGTLPARIWLMLANECGSGDARTIDF